MVMTLRNRQGGCEHEDRYGPGEEEFHTTRIVSLSSRRNITGRDTSRSSIAKGW
jgi:hypothetical protein